MSDTGVIIRARKRNPNKLRVAYSQLAFTPIKIEENTEVERPVPNWQPFLSGPESE